MGNKNLNPDFGFVEDWAPIEKPTSLGDVISSQFKLGLMNSETLSLGRMVQSSLVAKENDVISAEEANEMFPTETPFSEPISAAEASTIQGHQEEKRQLEEIIARGQTNMGSSFFGFTAGLAGAALDPIGILSGVALGGVGKSVLNRTLGKAFLGGTAKRRILEASIEGALGNIATEMAFVVPSQIQEKEDINITHQLLFAAAGGAAFPAVTGSIAAAYRGFKGISLDKLEDGINMTEARILADKNPNMSELEIELVTREKGDKLKNDYIELQDRIQETQNNMRNTTSEDEGNLFRDQVDQDQAALVEKAEEIRQYSETFNDAESIRDDANSDRNNIYNNPEMNELAAQVKDEPDVSFKELAEEEFNDLSDFEAPVRLEIEKVAKQFEEIDSQIDEIAKATHFCVRKGA